MSTNENTPEADVYTHELARHLHTAALAAEVAA